MKRIDAKPGDIIKIGLSTVKIEQKTGQIARLTVMAPPDVRIELVKARDALKPFAAPGLGVKAILPPDLCVAPKS